MSNWNDNSMGAKSSKLQISFFRHVIGVKFIIRDNQSFYLMQYLWTATLYKFVAAFHFSVKEKSSIVNPFWFILIKKETICYVMLCIIYLKSTHKNSL